MSNFRWQLFWVGTIGFMAVIVHLHHRGPGGDITSMSEEEERGQELERWRICVSRDIELRETIAQRLQNAEIGLFEAAACYRAMDRAMPHFHWQSFRRLLPGNSDEERHCREAIRAIRQYSREASAERERRVSQLEAELRQHLERNTLWLPEVDESQLLPVQ
jgi:hypothetical protein